MNESLLADTLIRSSSPSDSAVCLCLEAFLKVVILIGLSTKIILKPILFRKSFVANRV